MSGINQLQNIFGTIAGHNYQGYSYLISREGNTYTAQNNNGEIVFISESFSDTVQYAHDNIPYEPLGAGNDWAGSAGVIAFSSVSNTIDGENASIFYEVDKTIVVSKRLLFCAHSDFRRTVLLRLKDDANCDIIHVDGAKSEQDFGTLQLYGVKFSNIWFFGNKSNQSVGTAGIRVTQRATDIYVEDCRFGGFSGHGVSIEQESGFSQSWTFVRKSMFQGCDIAGLSFTTGGNVQKINVHGCEFDIASGVPAILLSGNGTIGQHGISITQNDFRIGGIVIDGNVINTVIAANYFSGSASHPAPIQFIDRASSTLRNAAISGNSFAGFPVNIEVGENSSNISAIGNVFRTGTPLTTAGVGNENIIVLDGYSFSDRSLTNPGLGIGENESFFIGDKNTDGSWRITISGTDLVFERRESGSYVSKGSFAS
ncbi:MAG: hypothetical protein LAT57_00085 [Balneolales bacterium]|nr:hypothetical protein [Balneolales bacterium]